MAESKPDNKHSKWITPFVKQCFVTMGVALSMMSHTTVLAFPTALLPQLRESHLIEIDDNSTSWIASIVGFGLITGMLTVPIIVHICGRRVINLIAAITVTLGWIIIYSATATHTFIIARYMQSVVNGFTAIVGPVLIGEYTSPRNRGAFLTTLTTSFAIGVFLAHATGSSLSWQKSALICGCISFVDIFIVLCSPESPLYLAKKGRYEECKKSYHWLKGDEENDELDKMIKTAMSEKEYKNQTQNILSYNLIKKMIKEYVLTLKKREFYKPVVVMFHLQVINVYCGVILFDVFAIDMLHTLTGSNINVPLVLSSLDLQAIVTNLLSIIIIKKFRRKTVLTICTLLTITAYLLISTYSYLRTQELLPFDYPIIGILLCHFHLAAIYTGCVSIPNIIAGEIFPFEYKGIGGMVSQVTFSVCLSVTLKVLPYLFSSIGLPGTYCVLAVLLSYGLIVSIIILPETKDKTLQDIEDTLKGNSIVGQKIESDMLIS
ncbi:facilitated trehalose transporter Tret1-like [Achroia grisella]|uniref:facilitated trehalose transporter Tret1-like n=1 Tax=Achroia grisella TaxID=688607 RepID=UPI0027D209D2|nr:facilitated trehalose transporter Tret1-like [Achroia grisella]